MSSSSVIVEYAKANDLPKKYAVILLVALVSSLLSTPIHFPFHPDFQFPIVLFTISFLDGLVIVHILQTVYKLFERRVFTKRVQFKHVALFILTCLIAIGVYFPLYFFTANYILGFTPELYSFVLSLLGSLILVSLFIVLFYGRKFVELLNPKRVRETLKVKSGRRIHYMLVDEIKYFFSRNKTVFLVDIRDKKIITDFMLNDLEPQPDKQSFFRANRQFLIQHNSISSISPALNEKLEVTLITDEIKDAVITISRYKAVKFKEWLKVAETSHH